MRHLLAKIDQAFWTISPWLLIGAATLSVLVFPAFIILRDFNPFRP